MNITIREPGSALTHFIAMLLALCAAVPLLVRAAVHSGVKSLTAMTVFMISMVSVSYTHLTLPTTSRV